MAPGYFCGGELVLAQSQIRWDSLYHASTGIYRTPEESDPGQIVTLRFRTARNDVEQVLLEIRDGESKALRKVFADPRFDYYETELRAAEQPLFYRFLIKKGEECVAFDRLGPSEESSACHYYSIFPGFHVPQWMKGCVMYQIYIDRFRNGNPKNDVQDQEYLYLGHPVEHAAWESPVESFDVHRFYGGDLQGVWEKLEYLRQLGVEAIYFNPLFVSPSNHKYDAQDYRHIDPHLACIVKDMETGEEASASGKNAGNPGEEGKSPSGEKYRRRTTELQNLEASDRFFIEFVQACHNIGIRVILDGVFNHSGSFHRFMNREGYYRKGEPMEGGVRYPGGAYEDFHSPYHSYYRFSKDRISDWDSGNGSYEQWWGNETLPKFNYEGSTALEEEILSIGESWVSAPYHCDGWRLDVAADLGHSAEYNHEFWQKFRARVKKANPEAVILAEHYGDASPWLNGKEWDSIMNYDAFMDPVNYFFTGMEKHSDEFHPELVGDGGRFFETILTEMAKLPYISLEISMNQLSNHDHSRFLTRTNHVVGRIESLGREAAEQGVSEAVYRIAALFQFTWPGAPTIYYGDEAGLCGWTDPDNRRPYPWGKENFILLDYHKYLGQARLDSKALRYGSVMKLLTEKNVIAYARLYKREVAVVCINLSDQAVEVTLPFWRAGILSGETIRCILMTELYAYNVGTTYFIAEEGELKLTIGKRGGQLFLCESRTNPFWEE